MNVESTPIRVLIINVCLMLFANNFPQLEGMVVKAATKSTPMIFIDIAMSVATAIIKIPW